MPDVRASAPAENDPERPRAERSTGIRSGLGQDSHQFGPGLGLRLGGIEFEHVPRLLGHSDGDVVLHAVADGLLGGAGLGDLGRLFPAGPETPRGADSRQLLGVVLERVAAAGLRPVAIDVTIVAARPRLSGRLDEIAASLAALLGLDRDRVSAKASTGNLAGMEGAGRGISALAMTILEPLPSPDHPAEGASSATVEATR